MPLLGVAHRRPKTPSLSAIATGCCPFPGFAGLCLGSPFSKNRFLAASRDRVYATDKIGRIRVLNAKTGVQLDTIPTESLPIKFTNTETDRLFLGTKTGMLLCLYEPEFTEPLLRHIPPKEFEKPLKPAKTAEQEPETPKPASKPSSSGSKPSSSTPKSTAPKSEKKAAGKKSKGAPDFTGGAGKKGRKGKGGGGGMPGAPGLKPPGA